MPRSVSAWLLAILPVVGGAICWTVTLRYMITWWTTPTFQVNLLGFVGWALSTLVLAVFGTRLVVMCVANLVVEIGQRIKNEQPQDEDEAVEMTETKSASPPAQL